MKIPDKVILVLGYVFSFIISMAWLIGVDYCFHSPSLFDIPTIYLMIPKLFTVLVIYYLGLFFANRAIEKRNGTILDLDTFNSRIRENISDFMRPQKYLCCFTLASNKISFLGDEAELNKILTWYNSGKGHYMINKSNGFIRINRASIIEFEWFSQSPFQIFIDSFYHVVFNPLPRYLTVKSLVRVLLLLVIGITGYRYLTGQEISISLLQNSLGNLFTIISSAIILFYLFYGIFKALSVIKNGHNYWETRRFKEFLWDSLAINTLLILALPYMGKITMSFIRATN